VSVIENLLSGAIGVSIGFVDGFTFIDSSARRLP